MVYHNNNKLLKFKNVIGIDFLSTKIDECKKSIEYAYDYVNNINSNNNNNDNNNNNNEIIANEEKYKKYLQLSLPKSTIILENFLSYDWKDAGIIIIIIIIHYYYYYYYYQMLYIHVLLASTSTCYHN